VKDIKSILDGELEAELKAWGEPAYRAKQVLRWVYERRVATWDAMTDLPRLLRERLARTYSFKGGSMVRVQGARDRTAKFLWRLSDGALIESVLIPANPALYGEPSDRRTLCISTQVGCAYGCRFCASGLEGWKRNLGAEEIVDQVIGVENWFESTSESPEAPSDRSSGSRGEGARAVSNLVIMGMGEPLANYENLLRALKIINASWGGGIGARKITISTSGLAPQIRRLAEEPLQFRLAISLHGATDETRNRIMPVNRKYPLKELTSACEYYLQKNGRLTTFEYILIAGINDGMDQIRPLASLAKRLNAKVNLIPYNRVEGLPWERPNESVQEAFCAALSKAGVAVTLRREKGHDIDAACGQLRLQTERAERASALL
jgi:23S rRNA (adenine2503-C2)-methyltransferase